MVQVGEDEFQREAKRRRVEASKLHEFGITETLSNREAAAALVKQRYCDFLVNEIVENADTGSPEVVRIKSMEWKDPLSASLLSKEEFVGKLADAGISKELASSVASLSSASKESLCTPESVPEKRTRTLIHEACRGFGCIDSRTLPDNRITFAYGKPGRTNWKLRMLRIA